MLLSKEELDESAVLHPDIAQLTAGSAPPPATTDEDMVAGSKQSLAGLSAAILNRIGSPPTGTVEFYKQIPMRDGYSSKIKIHRPEAGGGPLIVLLFGGGFLGGDCDQLSAVARSLVQLFGATVVNIDYRLAPEHKFPTAQLDAWDSMIWIANNATNDDLKSNPSTGFLMGGASAGAATTAVLSRKFQDTPLAHPFTGQWFNVPLLMDEVTVPEKYKDYHISRSQNAVNPTLSSERIDGLIRVVGIDTTSDLAYAVHAKTPLSGQPKTYFQVAGLDPLRDDGLIYEEMLKEAGVETRLDLYKGGVHGYNFFMPQLDFSKKANVDMLLGFGWLLGKEVGREEAEKALV